MDLLHLGYVTTAWHRMKRYTGSGSGGSRGNSGTGCGSGGGLPTE